MEYNGYVIEGDGTYGMKLIKGIGRGAIPVELRGAFTNITSARKAIDLSLLKKEKNNGEVVNSDRD